MTSSIQKLHAVRTMRLAVAFVPALLAFGALAAEHEQREHEAHAHGHGALDIVVEGEAALIEFRIPAVNVVGFEHSPRDDADREAVRLALEPLQDAASVFALPDAAKCTVDNAGANIVSTPHDDDHEDDEHGTDEHAAHEDEGSETDSVEEEHSELHATYRFRCAAPEHLDRIEVRLIEHLHDVEGINVRVVTPTAQLATELSSASAVVELSP